MPALTAALQGVPSMLKVSAEDAAPKMPCSTVEERRFSAA